MKPIMDIEIENLLADGQPRKVSAIAKELQRSYSGTKKAIDRLLLRGAVRVRYHRGGWIYEAATVSTHAIG